MRMSRLIIFAGLLLLPFQAIAQGTGGSSGGSAGGSAGAGGSTGAASPGAVTGSLSNPNPGSQISPNNLNAAGKPTLPNPPGTNSAGTAQSSGSSAGVGSGSVTTGSAGNRSGAGVGGVQAQGPNKPGDAQILEENSKIDKKIKSICRGC